MFLTRADKEKRVIELHKEGKSIREIAPIVHMGFSDISATIKKHFNEPVEEKKPEPSKFCAAVKLFKKGATTTDVVIKLDVTADEAEKFYSDYWRIERMYALYNIYQENKDIIPYLLRLYKGLRKKGITPKFYKEVFEIVQKQIFRRDDPALIKEESPSLSTPYSLDYLERLFDAPKLNSSSKTTEKFSWTP